mmetsp:Transcript_7015/g.28428  ORF Transcript_7015/g.28428 Transcript_7015/m.28428 type:complete len:211 (+) Transcript_7015:1215-1847(+)
MNAVRMRRRASPMSVPGLKYDRCGNVRGTSKSTTSTDSWLPKTGVVSSTRCASSTRRASSASSGSVAALAVARLACDPHAAAAAPGAGASAAAPAAPGAADTAADAGGTAGPWPGDDGGELLPIAAVGVCGGGAAPGDASGGAAEGPSEAAPSPEGPASSKNAALAAASSRALRAATRRCFWAWIARVASARCRFFIKGTIWAACSHSTA